MNVSKFWVCFYVESLLFLSPLLFTEVSNSFEVGIEEREHRRAKQSHCLAESVEVRQFQYFVNLWRYLKLTFRRRQWHPTPVLLPGKSHGRRSLVGCSPWGHWELDTTQWLHFDFSLSCIGEGNGNPLLCSCLENPGDRGAWWAAVCGVTESDTTEAT